MASDTDMEEGECEEWYPPPAHAQASAPPAPPSTQPAPTSSKRARPDDDDAPFSSSKKLASDSAMLNLNLPIRPPKPDGWYSKPSAAPVKPLPRAQEMPSPYSGLGKCNHQGGPLMAPFDRLSRDFIAPGSLGESKTFNDWPAIIEAAGQGYGTFRQSSTAVMFFAETCATSPSFGITLSDKETKAQGELRWDLSKLEGCRVEIFSTHDNSNVSASRKLNKLVQDMKLPERDAFNKVFNLGKSERKEFALVTLKRKHSDNSRCHRPAFFNNFKADYSSKPGFTEHEPVEIPSFGDESSARKAMDLAMTADEINIWVMIDLRSGDGLDDIKVFATIINEVSRLSIDGRQRSDWYWSRHKNYLVNDDPGKTDQFFGMMLKTQNDFPERQPWLQKDSAADKDADQYNPVWPASGLKTRYASGVQWSEVMTPGLLWELEESFRVYAQQYNERQKYVAVWQNLGDDYLVKVKLSGDGVTTTHGAKQVPPSAGTELKVFLENDPREDVYAWQGDVAEETIEGFDFVFRCKESVAVTNRLRTMPAGAQTVTIKLGLCDEQMGLLLEEASLCRWVDKSHESKADKRDGRTNFSHESLIMGLDVATLGPDYLTRWQVDKKPSLSEDDAAKIEREVTIDLPAKLNAPQRRAYFLALRGCRAAYLLLQGFPGTGKSKTFSTIVSAVVLLGGTVIISAHANAGCDAVFNKVCDYARLAHPEWIEKCKLVRIEASTIEAQIIEQLAAGTTPEDVVCKVAPENIRFTAGYLKYRFMQTEEGKGLGNAYKSIVSQRKSNKAAFRAPSHPVRLDGDLNAHKVKTLLWAEAIGNHKPQVFSVTAATSDKLREYMEACEMTNVDMLVFDEASQAIEPALLLAARCKPASVLIGGDHEQLPAFVLSLGSNPEGPQIEQSSLARLISAHPDRPMVQLNINYRGHPHTIPMASAISYKGKMVSGWTEETYKSSKWAQEIERHMANGLCDNIFAKKPGHRQWFIDYDGHCKVKLGSQSAYNPNGDRAIVDFVGKLMELKHSSQAKITIITIYGDDREELQRLLEEAGLGEVEVATVDSFQGRENDIMILHMAAAWMPVKVKETGKVLRVNPLGFSGHRKRLNVAISRAKDYSFIFGNISFWRDRFDFKDLKEPQRYQLQDNEVPKCIAPTTSPIAKLIKYVTENDEVVRWPGAKAVEQPARVGKVPEIVAATLMNEDAEFDDEEWQTEEMPAED